MRGDGNGNIVLNKVTLTLLAVAIALLTFVATTYTDLGMNKQRIATNERDISALRKAIDRNGLVLLDIQERLARIEAKLEGGNGRSRTGS